MGEVNTKVIEDGAKDLEIDLNSSEQYLTMDLLRWYDLAIIVADDVPKEIFKGRVEKWEISDKGAGKIEGVHNVIKEIEVEVKNLIKKLKK